MLVYTYRTLVCELDAKDIEDFSFFMPISLVFISQG